MSEAQRLAMSERMKGKQPPHLAKLVKENHPRLGKTHTPESRAKMSATRLGKKMPPRSEEHCRKISEYMKGRPVSGDTARKIGDANRGKIRTVEQLARLSKASRKQVFKDSQRAALLKANLGKKRSPETLARISQSRSRPAPDIINTFTGEIIRGVKSRFAFAKERGLSPCGFYRMLRGESKACEGWVILENSTIDKK